MAMPLGRSSISSARNFQDFPGVVELAKEAEVGYRGLC